MVLSVKNKIWLGTLFLFLLLLLTGGVGIYYTLQLKDQAKAVLQDNYETLSYAHGMQKELDAFTNSNNCNLPAFDSMLRLQEQNITEPGEEQATRQVRKDYQQLKTGDTSKALLLRLRSNLQQIISLNMEAINTKSKNAEAAASNTLKYIMGLAGVVFLIAFTFIVNFPSVITNPIRQFTEAIKEIAAKNYNHRIHLQRKDEYGKLANAFNEMAERLQYFESSNLNKLMFEKNRAEAVINSLKDASIGIDKYDKVLFANAQALQLLGIKAADTVGKKVADVAARNDLFRFLVSSDSKTPFKIVVDDKENYFSKEIVEVEQGDARNKVIVIKNITSFKELDVAKTNFIATISHELKTPLASSDFSLKLLEDERTGKLNAEQAELLQHIRQDNQRILKILSELLNMSQVETGRIQLNKQKVQPAIIVQNAVHTVMSAAKEKHLELVMRQDSLLPDIEVDAEKTTWVLNNFLTNAIKYSPENNVIEVSTYQKDNALRFAVKDNGSGIAKEYHHRLFERYFQVPGSKFKGTGLGLAISKDFIEAQDGKIWVESEMGQGSTFLFELPVTSQV
ncbi:MAG TPA: ATP-binding protein [Panacibacter sp.]|nr:ATP-binding protein [Panacibacter sp.]HNP44079.1 ATP-binding protein [Panacibacter sp.]